MHHRSVTWTVCLFALLTRVAWAQLPSIAFETLTTKEGLPSNTVLSAIKDHQGFMWFGTRQCPTRYDGATFRNFLDFETNLVMGLAEDATHQIWAATDRSGVCKIAANTLAMTAVHTASPKASQQTGNFFIDSYQQGWYSDRYGVNRMNLRTAKAVHYPFRQTNYVWLKGSFLEDRQGNLWVIGADNGLFRYDRSKDTLACVLGADCPDPQRQDPIVFTKGCVDQDGFLWLGTQNRGLLRYNPANGTYRTYALPPSYLINDVEEGWDENGRRMLWWGDSEGLGIFRPDEQQFYRFPHLLPDAYEVYDIYRDKTSGIVWVCTTDGVLKYNPRSNLIQTIALPSGLLAFPTTITAFCQDRTDSSGETFWLGLSHTGLLRWHRKTNQFTLVPIPPAGSSPETRWITQRADGTLWVGVNRRSYTGNGLVVYDPKHNQFVGSPLSRLANCYYSVPFFMYGFFDQRQRLWIGNSDEGIHVLDERSAKEVTPWDSLTQGNLIKNNNLINDMRIDRRGRVWLATYLGVYYVDEARRRFVSADSLSPALRQIDPAANTLFEDRRGNLWAARWGSVTQMDSNGFLRTVLTKQEGLYDRENRGVVEDRLGNIWIGNYEGLHCYNPLSKHFLRFTANDGLMSNNTMERLFVTRDGNELLIGQKNGLNRLRIDQLLGRYLPPQVAVSAFRIHEKVRHVDFSRPIQLKRSENAFSVDFIALNYNKLQNNQYAYYLEGLETKWNYSGNNHLAYYTNLDPGSYTLRMKAGDSFGNWNATELRLQLTIMPAFYETWWFRLLMLAVAVGALYGLYRYRINQLLRLQRVRNRISADLHDEIGASLSGMSIMGMMARKNLQENHPSVHFLERMMEETHQISTSLDDIVWSINPKNDGLPNLIARMTRYVSELLEAKNIGYQMTLPERIEDATLSMEQRRDLYLIFKESVTNLVKYARCTQVRIEITIQQHQFRLVVQDNGVGFDPSAHSERNGLRNLRKRAESLRGHLSIDSAPGNGTTILLSFPVAM